MASVEDHKTIACRWLDCISEHRLEELCAMTASSWVMHGGPPGLPPGPEGIRELFRQIGPVKQRWSLEDIIAEGDKVVLRARNLCFQDRFLGLVLVQGRIVG